MPLHLVMTGNYHEAIKLTPVTFLNKFKVFNTYGTVEAQAYNELIRALSQTMTSSFCFLISLHTRTTFLNANLFKITLVLEVIASTNMSRMALDQLNYRICTILKLIDLSSFDTSNHISIYLKPKS